MSGWTQLEAVNLCKAVEAVCPAFGCHVALTGGCLYADGERKDCDILFYRIRQKEIRRDDLWLALAAIGLNPISGYGWCVKAVWFGKRVDCFFPESESDDAQYRLEDESQPQEVLREFEERP